MDSQRPRLQIPWSLYEKFLEPVAVAAIVSMVWILVRSYEAMPETIPTKYDLTGEVQAFGGKSRIIILPILNLFIYLGFNLLARYPHTFNYLTAITEKNAQQQYLTARQLLNTIKTISNLILTTILYGVVNQVSTRGFPEHIMSLILAFLGSIFIAIFYFGNRLRKL